MLRLWLLNTGYCTANERTLLRHAPRREVKVYALAALLEHPREGLILFDTGYAPRLLELFKTFPSNIYGYLTPTTTREEWSAVSQIKRLGYTASDIRMVIISHLHADHIAGLQDFPNATFLLSKDASKIGSSQGFSALRHGFITSLFPKTVRIQKVDSFQHQELPELGQTHDIFGDGLLRLIQLPGHARGQLGLVVQTTHGNVLLAADGCWSTKAYRDNHPPSLFAMRLLFDNIHETRKTLEHLHNFHKANPKVLIIPSHCPNIAARVELGKPTRLEDI
jgi:glyoxylase-like metal-dependent hydrolase (beta-lactamase superfamily II)